jgi:hypothetical protein
MNDLPPFMVALLCCENREVKRRLLGFQWDHVMLFLDLV